MIKNIKGISINGGYFKNKCSLCIFPKDDDTKKVALIYGKNGSGKTCISKAFYEYANGCKEFNDIQLLDNGLSYIDKKKIDLTHIHVFNEKFIEEKIRFKNDGLDAIVMFGGLAELDKEIDEKKEIIIETRKKIDEYVNEIDKNKSEYYKGKLRQDLQQDWASKESIINNSKINARVEDKVISSILSHNCENIEEFSILDEKLTKIIEKIKSVRHKKSIDKKIEEIPFKDNLDDNIKSILQKTFKNQNFSEREKHILNIINSAKSKYLLSAKEELTNENLKECPFCLQPLTNEYITELLKSINIVMGQEEIEKFKEKTKELSIDFINIELSLYKDIDNELIRNIEQLLENYNKTVNNIRTLIEKKLYNVYLPIEYSYNLKEQQEAINKALNFLDKKRIEYNNDIASSDDIIKEAKIINFNLAFRKNYSLIELINKEQGELLKLNEEKNKAEEKIQKIENDITILNARKKSIDIAVDILNKFLSYIFFSKDRLSIQIVNEKYHVKSRGENIKLEELSTGERNVIALSYFFSTLYDKKKEEEYLQEESLIIIDDPVSSFDYENKIGIMSFLRLMLERCLKANKANKFILLTHEIGTFYNLNKVCEDIDIIKKSYIKYELKNKQLHKLPENKYYEEYRNLLLSVFGYAEQNNDNKDKHDTIGNLMRRLLEAFGTYNYRVGIDKLTTDDEILNQIDDVKKREYFKNLMYRLILHGESHMEMQTKAFPQIDFFQFIDNDEKIRTAKEIIVFMYLLHPLHIEKQFLKEENKDVMEKIKEWENEINY